MIEQKSSLKKSIQGMIRMTTIIAFGAFQERKKIKFAENAAGDSLYMKLTQKIDKGELLYVEDFVFDRIGNRKREDFRLALDVFDYMNEKSDDFLKQYDFQRSKIEEDVRLVIERYDYGFVL